MTPVSREEVPGLLASRFSLEGFALDADGRVTMAGVAAGIPCDVRASCPGGQL